MPILPHCCRADITRSGPLLKVNRRAGCMVSEWTLSGHASLSARATVLVARVRKRLARTVPTRFSQACSSAKGSVIYPDSLSWLRPFAITGAIVDEAPVGSTGGKALAPNLTTGRLQSVFAPRVNTLDWGFSIE
jgi:hypothetical protein